MGERRLHHRRLHDWEAFDRITLDIVPRYKTSGLSGDEWRQSVRIVFWHKGQEVHEEWFTSMRAALAHLPAEVSKATCPIPEKVTQIDKTKCDQPSCTNDAVARCELKRLTSARGEYLAVEESKYTRYYRQFCRKHLQRGDCSREDADDNYIPLDGVTADASTNVEESPSAVVVVDAAHPTTGANRGEGEGAGG